jgi:5-methylcytosine-specific restriction endonuclease McrA
MDKRQTQLKEFICRTKDELKNHIDDMWFEITEKHRYKCRLYNERHRQKIRQLNSEYEKTERGRQLRKEVNLRRKERFKKACEGLTEEEDCLMQDFYDFCPEGYHVDHIIPLAKGGLHRLNNLQYLTPEENARKGTRILYRMDIIR